MQSTKHCCVQVATDHCRDLCKHAVDIILMDGGLLVNMSKCRDHGQPCSLFVSKLLFFLCRPQKYKMLRFPNMDLEQAGSIQRWQIIYCLSNSFPPDRAFIENQQSADRIKWAVSSQYWLQSMAMGYNEKHIRICKYITLSIYIYIVSWCGVPQTLYNPRSISETVQIRVTICQFNNIYTKKGPTVTIWTIPAAYGFGIYYRSYFIFIHTLY